MKRWLSHLVLFTIVTGATRQELRASLVDYSLSGSASAIESGTYDGVIEHPNGTFTPVHTSFSNRPGTIDFSFEFSLDPNDPSFAFVTGYFSAGDLTVESFLVSEFQDSAPGAGEDFLHIIGADPAAPENKFGDFWLKDSSGMFFETQNLSGVAIHTSITVLPGGLGFPNYAATGDSHTLTPIPEPSSFALLGVAALVGLGGVTRKRRDG